MPTRAGWLVVGAGALLVVLGRLLGVVELYVLGTGAAAAVALSAALVWLPGSKRLDTRRLLHPARVHTGSDARVEVVVHNQGRRPAPPLLLSDPVSGTTGASVAVLPVPAGARFSATYRLPTARRGLVSLGPLRVDASDPFGLARRRLDVPGAGSEATLTVLPVVDPVPAPPLARAREPLAGASRRRPTATAGADLHALRPYVVGDDLRRVHWPSSARHDDLLVRQDEVPWQARTTVVLDAGATGYTAETFESAVSAAASVVAAAWRRLDLVRLVVSSGVDLGFAAGQAHVDAALEVLATVEPEPAADLAATVAAVGREAHGGTVVVVTGAGGGPEPSWQPLAEAYGAVVVVRCTPDAGAPAVPAGGRTPRRRDGALLATLSVGPQAPFAAGWSRLAAAGWPPA